MQQHESTISNGHKPWVTYIHFLLSLSPTPSPFHHSRLSESTGLSSLCYTATSHWLSLLHMVMYVCQDFPGGSVVKNLPAVQETWVQSLGQEDPLERARQPTPVFLPGECLWTERPVGLQFIGSHRIGHDWRDKGAAAAAVYICQCHIQKHTYFQNNVWPNLQAQCGPNWHAKFSITVGFCPPLSWYELVASALKFLCWWYICCCCPDWARCMLLLVLQCPASIFFHTSSWYPFRKLPLFMYLFSGALDI